MGIENIIDCVNIAETVIVRDLSLFVFSFLFFILRGR